MLESDKQVEDGLQSNAFGKDEYVRVDQTMNRLCAPTDNSPSKPMKSFILWTKDSPADNEPTWDKVVSLLVFDLLCLPSMDSTETHSLVE
jgi:hypothetical protein